MISCDLASDLKSHEQNGRAQKNKKIRMTTELIST